MAVSVLWNDAVSSFVRGPISDERLFLSLATGPSVKHSEKSNFQSQLSAFRRGTECRKTRPRKTFLCKPDKRIFSPQRDLSACRLNTPSPPPPPPNRVIAEDLTPPYREDGRQRKVFRSIAERLGMVASPVNGAKRRMPSVYGPIEASTSHWPLLGISPPHPQCRCYQT